MPEPEQLRCVKVYYKNIGYNVATDPVKWVPTTEKDYKRHNDGYRKIMYRVMPLSEQKHDGETVEQFIKQSYEHYLPLSECLNMLSDGDLNTHDCLGSLVATMEAYASQHTANQIEEKNTELGLAAIRLEQSTVLLLSCEAALDSRDNQIYQYKDRIAELEAENSKLNSQLVSRDIEISSNEDYSRRLLSKISKLEAEILTLKNK